MPDNSALTREPGLDSPRLLCPPRSTERHCHGRASWNWVPQAAPLSEPPPYLLCFCPRQGLGAVPSKGTPEVCPLRDQSSLEMWVSTCWVTCPPWPTQGGPVLHRAHGVLMTFILGLAAMGQVSGEGWLGPKRGSLFLWMWSKVAVTTPFPSGQPG